MVRVFADGLSQCRRDPARSVVEKEVAPQDRSDGVVPGWVDKHADREILRVNDPVRDLLKDVGQTECYLRRGVGHSDGDEMKIRIHGRINAST